MNIMHKNGKIGYAITSRDAIENYGTQRSIQISANQPG